MASSPDAVSAHARRAVEVRPASGRSGGLTG
jgi:hypothetical protein